MYVGMDSRDVELALLLKIVQEQNFDLMLKNNVTLDQFSEYGQIIYKYIEDYLDRNSGEYMHPDNICRQFNIDAEEFSRLMNTGSVIFCMDALKSTYNSNQILEKLKVLNEKSGLVKDQPNMFIQEFDLINDEFKQLNKDSRSVDLLEDMEQILQLDINNVISTGFKELDEHLIGWNRGEDLIVLMGRPRTR